MVGNNLVPDNSGGILVEFDYNNIIVVDPNKTIDANGNVKERLVDHENLVMFVNLEAEVLPRTKLAVGGSPQDAVRTVSIAKINFLAPNEKDYFSTSYYDELTGLNSTGKDPRTNKFGMGINQPQETIVGNPQTKQSYVKAAVVNNGIEGAADNGLLGITSINVRLGLNFIPSVTIELEDVQGKALFQLGDRSPYAAFFNMPYPPFYLTMKGYYGQAIRYQLQLEKFNARFNSFSGNYQVSLEFKGYKFNILNEIQMGHLLAAPHMYSTRFTLSPTTNAPKNVNKQSVANGNVATAPTNGNEVGISSVVAEKGYEKILQVYSDYKSKGLLAPDFPEITFYQLMDKIKVFEKSIMAQYTQADVQPLTDCRTYKQKLVKYYEQVYQSNDSWFTTWMNPNPLITKDGKKLYIYKNGLSAQAKNDSILQLTKYVTENNQSLANTGTLGSTGKFPINNPITVDGIKKDSFDKSNIDFLETLRQQGVFASGLASPEVINFEKSLSEFFIPKLVKKDGSETTEVLKDPVFNMEFFIESIRKMEAIANKKLGDFETQITADLAKKLEDDKIGLGFRPTVRNITGIIMASAEGFIRLMDEVHSDAWNLRNDPIRKSAILGNNSSAVSSDAKQYAPSIGTSAALNSAQIPIYPWPQFFVETNEDKKGRFQLKYLADPSVVELTKAYRYDKWPEVEFVEEYLKGLTMKFDPPIVQPPTSTDNTTDLLNINALEFPQGNIAYRNKQELRFFYEIWERQFVTAYFTGLGRVQQLPTGDLLELVSNYESQNIFESINISSPYLSYKLKNYNITARNYQNTLYSFSNQGTGRLYQDFIRDFFVTTYLKSLIDKSFSVLELNEIGPELNNNLATLTPQLKNVIDSTPFNPIVIDTYPFTNNLWCSNNLVGNDTNIFPKRYDTNKVLKIYEAQNVISNFTDLQNYKTNRPVTNFGYLKPKNPIERYEGTVRIDDYYLNTGLKDLLPTEGLTFSDSPATNEWGTGKNLPLVTSTSILNTPFFVNSILQGVDKWRRGNKNPYKAAAYLFINSLPLISLREKLKSVANTTEINGTITSTALGVDDLNYMFASLKKFGAVHKLPYAWILKIGSVWNRYKTYKQTGIDFLDEVWTDFDYFGAYDPKDRDISKTYTFLNSSSNQNKSETISIQLQSTSDNSIKIQPGFYPKVINDFNVFYNGYDLFSNYTDQEIQVAMNRGMQIFNFQGSNINNVVGKNGTIFNVEPWSVLLPANIEVSANTIDCNTTVVTNIERLYTIPSFGIDVNESKDALSTYGTLQGDTTFVGNNAMYNGSARLFWAASNYGYFDTTKIKKPQYDEYTNVYKKNAEEMVPFRLSHLSEYMKIDEVFGVFEKRILDSFEEEFLNFTKPLVDIEGGVQVGSYNNLPSEQNDIFRNFQLLFKNMMLVPPNLNKRPQQVFFKDSITEQFSQISNQINSFLQYDILFRYGNPSEYNRRVFASFLSHGGTQVVTDPIFFEPYSQNTLPSSNGTTTLGISKQNFPKEWLELELQVGFSTIEQLRYKNNGSYITDFFIDNNIKFTVENITILAPLIKMYATQKLQNNVTPNGFKAAITNYLNNCGNIQNKFIDDVLDKVRTKLPNQSQLPETVKPSILDGTQSKVSFYETFKALNDKWIAGGDYETKTIFEDILFLDRASRDIGNVLLVDVFKLQRILSEGSIQMNMSVYTFIAGLLIDNEFTIMNLPAYVNFYNAQDVDGVSQRKPEGTLDFANNLWGTFLNVDYRKSGPKMVCFFTGRPSNYLNLPENNYYRFRDDAFDLRRASDNPLIESWQNKTDWATSNRCVGFNVDIGIRNQNIFYSFNVGQDSGKATAEAVQQQLNMINNVSGLGNSTQNTGLYNYYTQRSYPCTVVSLGNAMIQPTMYFNLRHVPMFNGPYMIQEVTHTIQPGSFQTQFTGIRQGIFDYPQLDKYLQSINQNLLTKLETLLKNKKDVPVVEGTTNAQKASAKPSDSKQKPSTENSCDNSVKEVYKTEQFVSTKFVQTTVTAEQMITEINDLMIKKNDNDPVMKATIFSICYTTTFKENKFIGYGNNYSAAINLNVDFGASRALFTKTYMCVTDNKNTYAWANFDTLGKFLEFMYDRLKNNIGRIIKEGLWQYYNCFFPVTGPDVAYFQANKTSNNIFKTDGDRLTAGLVQYNTLATNTSLKLQKLDVQLLISGNVQKDNPKKKENPPNNQNTTSNTNNVCIPPKILSFSPTGATINGTTFPTITLSGTSLSGNTKVFLNNLPATVKTITNTQLTFVPTVKQTGKIKVVTSGGTDETTSNFVFV